MVHSASWGAIVCVCAADSRAEPSPDGMAPFSVTPGLILPFSAWSMPDFCSYVLFFEERKSYALSLQCKKNLFKCF